MKALPGGRSYTDTLLHSSAATFLRMLEPLETKCAFAIEAHSVEDPELAALQIHRGDLHVELLEVGDGNRLEA